MHTYMYYVIGAWDMHSNWPPYQLGHYLHYTDPYIRTLHICIHTLQTVYILHTFICIPHLYITVSIQFIVQLLLSLYPITAISPPTIFICTILFLLIADFKNWYWFPGIFFVCVNFVRFIFFLCLLDKQRNKKIIMYSGNIKKYHTKNICPCWICNLQSSVVLLVIPNLRKIVSCNFSLKFLILFLKYSICKYLQFFP